jgi:hypothetical protein
MEGLGVTRAHRRAEESRRGGLGGPSGVTRRVARRTGRLQAYYSGFDSTLVMSKTSSAASNLSRSDFLVTLGVGTKGIR